MLVRQVQKPGGAISVERGHQRKAVGPGPGDQDMVVFGDIARQVPDAGNPVEAVAGRPEDGEGPGTRQAGLASSVNEDRPAGIGGRGDEAAFRLRGA